MYNNRCITHQSDEYKEIVDTINRINQAAEKSKPIDEHKLSGECYLTTYQMMKHLHISRRALQNYRDKRIIPYTVIGGVILYPESKIDEILKRNYYKPNI